MNFPLIVSPSLTPNPPKPPRPTSLPSPIPSPCPPTPCPSRQGLDPLEVYEELPKALQEAYDSGDVATLRSYMDSVPLEEAKVIMKKMVGA